MLTIPARVIASCFALVSFAAAAIEGMAVGNRLLTIIGRATVVMLIAWAVGMALGVIAQRTVDTHIETYKKQHPIPSADDQTDRVAQADAETQSPAEPNPGAEAAPGPASTPIVPAGGQQTQAA